MKSNIFDINRFGLLIKKKFIESKSTTIYEVLGLAAIFAVFLGVMATSGSISEKAQAILFSIGLAITSVIYADRAFSETKGRAKGMAYMLVPASRFEKLLSAIFITSVLFPIMYSLIFFLVDGLFYIGLNATGVVTVEAFSWFRGGELFHFIVPMLVVQSLYMLGSIWFGKRSLLKTTLSVVLFYGLMLIVVVFVFRANVDSMGRMPLSFESSEVLDFVHFDILKWIFPPFFWVVTYFRLSEKQI